MLRWVVSGLILSTSVTWAGDAATLETAEELPQMPAVGAVVALPAAPAREFDFWLGEWNVLNKRVGDSGWNDSGAARALVQPVVDGKAVLEQWTGAINGNPLIGFSLRAFDPQLDKWVTWLNWHGGRPAGFSPMHGVRNGERLELFPPGDDTALRYSFSQPREGSCQWDEARSSDGGKTWTTRWIMQFTRASAPLPVDAMNAPIVEAPASARTYAATRKLDFLIGAWEGPARVRADTDDEWRDVSARARVSTMIDGFALLQYVDTDNGVKTMAALGSDAAAKAWVALSVDQSGAGIRRLTGQPAAREVTFTAGGDAPDRRMAWDCASDSACTFRRETTDDGGSTWELVFEADLERSASTVAVIDIPRVRTPFPGILTGGQLSADDLQWAARNGYRTVVNLRAPGEKGELTNEADLVSELGMEYVQIPISGGEGINVENARRLAQSLAGADALPAIVHCLSGARVGALFAIKAHEVDGVPVEKALEIGRAAGMGGIEQMVRKKLAAPEKAE